MLEDERNHHPWLKFISIVIATFLGAFLAFYFVVDITFNRITSTDYQIKKMEKMMRKQEKRFHKFEDKLMENPFEPKMAPMLINSEKRANDYIITVDLKPLGGNEKNLDVKLDNNVVTISGEMDKKERHGEKMINFSQAFYLDENLLPEKMTKEKKGNQYIITIPFEED